MRALLRLFALALGLLLLTVVPALVWAPGLVAEIAPDGVRGWIDAYGRWAWAAGMGLIVADVVLPTPSTAVMAALGMLYGPVLGGAAGGAASFLAGMLAYGLCRALGPRVAHRLASPEDLAEARRLLRRHGGWLVVISRWLPVLPETVAFLAGLGHMPAGRFALALAMGALPLGFALATAGHLGAETPVATIALVGLAPLALWLAAAPFLLRR